MTPQRVNIITLGVADLQRARAFYAALGWRPAQETEGISFYQMPGQVLALFPMDGLAEDQGRPSATEAEVDAAFAEALAAGATALKAPEKAFWGGYSGYWADPDGHVWEMAMNPWSQPAADGSLTLGATDED